MVFAENRVRRRRRTAYSSTPPQCLFHHQATFMTEFFESNAGARKGEYDFFPFPTAIRGMPTR